MQATTIIQRIACTCVQETGSTACAPRPYKFTRLLVCKKSATKSTCFPRRHRRRLFVNSWKSLACWQFARRPLETLWRYLAFQEQEKSYHLYKYLGARVLIQILRKFRKNRILSRAIIRVKIKLGRILEPINYYEAKCQ